MNWTVVGWVVIFAWGVVGTYVSAKLRDEPRGKRGLDCPDCRGSGYSALMMACHTCGGYGVVKERR